MEKVKRGIDINRRFNEKKDADLNDLAVVEKINRSNINRGSTITPDGVSRLTKDTASRIKNNDHILELFPETEIAIEVITSSILRGNDGVTEGVNYTIDPSVLPVGSIRNSITTLMKGHMERYYGLESNLPDVIRKAMFTDGAYVQLVIPEGILRNTMGINDKNKQITAGIEKYFKKDYIPTVGLGLLGNSAHIPGLESLNGGATGTGGIYEDDLGISIIEDYGFLTVATEKASAVSDSIKDRIRTRNKKELKKVTDGLTKALGGSLNANIFDKNNQITNIDYDKNLAKDSVGLPLIMTVDSECVVPLTLYGDTGKHLGYFVLLNQNGSPISKNDRQLYADSLASNNSYTNSGNNSTAQAFLDRVRANLGDTLKTAPLLQNAETIYNELVDSIIKKRVADGSFAGISEINVDSGIYKTMFARFLANKQTKLIFLPAEFVMYYAYEFRENGTGLSKMEKVASLYSLRSILLFAKSMATAKNSTNTTEITVTLDDDDPDPQKTASQIMAEMAKTRQLKFPLGVQNPTDLVEWSSTIGTSYVFKGAGMPNIDISVSDTVPSKAVPDESLDEDLEEKIATSFGLTLELIKAGQREDFATMAENKKILFNNRMTTNRNKTNDMITKHARLILNNDIRLYESVYDIIDGNISEIKKVMSLSGSSDEAIVDELLNNIIESVELTLPNSTVSDSDPLKAMLDEFISSVDSVLDGIFGDESSPSGLFGVMGEKIPDMKAILRNTAIRRFISDNHILPEITDFFTLDEDGKIVYDAMADYNGFIEHLSKALGSFYKENTKIINKSDKALNKVIGSDDSTDDAAGSDDYGDTSDTDTDVDTGNDNDFDTDTDSGAGDGSDEDTGDEDGIDDGSTDDAGDTEESTDEAAGDDESAESDEEENVDDDV
jgi:hypothetical protein